MDTIGTIYALLFAFGFGWLLYRYFHVFDRRILLLAWTVKVAGTFALLALFTYYYTDRSTSDIHRFFDDGLSLNKIAYSAPIDFIQIIFGWDADRLEFRTRYFEGFSAWIKPHDSGFYNDNHIMIKANALMTFVSFGSIEVHSICFSMLAFIGMLWMMRFLLDQKHMNWALLLVSIYPSQLIWLSGGLKESLLCFALGLFLFAWHRWQIWGAKSAWLLLMVGSLILAQIKLYFLLFLLPLMLWDALCKYFSTGKYGAITILVFSSIIAVWGLEQMGISPMEYTVRKQHEFINHANEINAGSAFETTRLEYSYPSVIAFIPEAVINIILRPFPWEAQGLPAMLMTIENIYFIAILTLLIFIILKRNRPLLWPRWLLPYAFGLIVLIGLITPVFGASMRYRAPIFLLLIIASAPYIRSLMQKSPHGA